MRVSKERITALGFFETVEISLQAGRERQPHRDDGGGEEEGHRHLPGGRWLLRREIHLHGPGQSEQLPRLGQHRLARAGVRAAAAFTASFFEPYFLDSDFYFTLDLFRTQIDSMTSRASRGRRHRLGLPRPRRSTAALTYTLEAFGHPGGWASTAGTSPHSRRHPLAGQRRFRSGLTSSLRLSLTYDRAKPALPDQARRSARRRWRRAGPGETSTSPASRPTPASTFRCRWNDLQDAVHHWLHRRAQPANRLPISSSTSSVASSSLRGYTLNSISPEMLLVGTLAGVLRRQPVHGRGNKESSPTSKLESPSSPKAGVRGVVFDAGASSPWTPTSSRTGRTSCRWGLFLATGLASALALGRWGRSASSGASRSPLAPRTKEGSLRFHHRHSFQAPRPPPQAAPPVAPQGGPWPLASPWKRLVSLTPSAAWPPLVCAHFFAGVRRASVGPLSPREGARVEPFRSFPRHIGAHIPMPSRQMLVARSPASPFLPL